MARSGTRLAANVRMLRRVGRWAVGASVVLVGLGVVGLGVDAARFRAARRGRSGARMHVESVEVRGRRGVLLEAGRGKPVVVLASMLVRARSYLPLIQALGRSRRVIVVELPGSGRASRLSRPWSIEAYSDWVAAWLEEADLKQVDLVGHSNSGPVAMQVAARSPRIERLVLVRQRGGAAATWRGARRDGPVGGRLQGAWIELAGLVAYRS